MADSVKPVCPVSEAFPVIQEVNIGTCILGWMIPMDKECPFTSIIRNTKNIAKTVPALKPASG